MRMKTSVLRRLFWSCLGFGMAMGVVFPFYAQLFVTVGDGMFWYFSISCWAAGISIGLVNYALVKAVLIRRLERLAAVSDAIGRRDLTHHCDMQSDDVLGKIADSVNMMAENLRRDLARIETASRHLSETSRHLSSSSNNIVEQVAEQQQQTDQVATAMNEMTATVVEVARHASEAAESAQQADEASGRGKEVIAASIGDFDNLSHQMDAASTVVQNLVADSEKVSSVLAVIQSIAEQTNLLALNAAIEAARAGEQGRGFAVVADEVRTLASRTHESTQEIQQMVDRIQAGTGSAVNAMNTARSKTDESVERVAEVAEALAEITGSVSRINEMSAQIAHAVNEQKQVAEDISRNINAMHLGAQQAVQSAQSERRDTQSLIALVSELHELVAQFKLAKDEPLQLINARREEKDPI